MALDIAKDYLFFGGSIKMQIDFLLASSLASIAVCIAVLMKM